MMSVATEVTSALLERSRTPVLGDSVLNVAVISVVNVCPAVAIGGIVSVVTEVTSTRLERGRLPALVSRELDMVAVSVVKGCTPDVTGAMIGVTRAATSILLDGGRSLASVGSELDVIIVSATDICITDVVGDTISVPTEVTSTLLGRGRTPGSMGSELAMITAILLELVARVIATSLVLIKLVETPTPDARAIDVVVTSGVISDVKFATLPSRLEEVIRFKVEVLTACIDVDTVIGSWIGRPGISELGISNREELEEPETSVGISIVGVADEVMLGTVVGPWITGIIVELGISSRRELEEPETVGTGNIAEVETVGVKMSRKLVPVPWRMLELILEEEPLLVHDIVSPGIVKLRRSKDRGELVASGRAIVDGVKSMDAVMSGMVDEVERIDERMSGTGSSCSEVNNCIDRLPVLGLVNDEPNPVGSLYTCEPDTIYNR